MLKIINVYLYLGLLFLVCIPFVLFVKQKKASDEKVDLSEAMH